MYTVEQVVQVVILLIFVKVLCVLIPLILKEINRKFVKSKLKFVLFLNNLISISFIIVESNTSPSFQNNCNHSPMESPNVLLHETRYSLNSSKSKYISVGIIYDNYSHCFKPSVWFGGPKFKNSIILDNRDWINMLSFKNIISSNDGENNKPIVLNSCRISFGSFNDIRVVKLEDNFSNNIYLGDESIHGLWLISDVIQYRLDMIENLSFDTYFKNIMTSLTNFTCDKLVDSVSKKIDSGQRSENVCIAKEFIARYPSFLEQLKYKPFGYY